MRTKYTPGSIIANRLLVEVVGHSPNKAKIWSWDCALCGTSGKPMNTSMLARCRRLDSTPVCCNTGINNKQYKGSDCLSQDYVTRIRRMARAKNRSFEVNLEYLSELLRAQDFRCAISGLPLPPRIGREKGGASLDRIDSSKDYIKGNVQWVLTDVNKMKTDLPQDRFIEICRAIARHNP